MKVIAQYLIVTLVMLNLTACGWLFGKDGIFRDRSNDYRQATVEPPLKLPGKLSDDSIDDRYAIPPISDRTSLSEQFVVPRPEPLDDSVERGSVRINTLGHTRWILVNGSPGQVWPRLRGFLNLNNLGVQRADASDGILETDWLQPKEKGLPRERYRLRIEQGVQRGTSEVHVLQADIRAGLDNWPKHSSNDTREKLMVKELAQYLANSSAAAAVSMLAQQAIDSTGRVSLREFNNGQPYLKLLLPFYRAWAGVGLALHKAGFTVDDLNREARTYYVHYLDKDNEDNKPGFFSSLFGSDNKKSKGTAYLVYVKEQGKQRDDDPNSGNATITIQRQDGKAMDRQEAIKLLKLIKRHLS